MCLLWGGGLLVRLVAIAQEGAKALPGPEEDRNRSRAFAAKDQDGALFGGSEEDPARRWPSQSESPQTV